MLNEFKDFAAKGNLVDLAVGFIMGGAFATVVSSLVNDVIMPVVGMLLGGVDFSNLFVQLTGDTPHASLDAAKEAGDAAIGYGLFINNVITFLIVAWVMFIIVKAVNKMKKAEEEKPAEPAAQEVLLGEIRDLLKK